MNDNEKMLKVNAFLVIWYFSDCICCCLGLCGWRAWDWTNDFRAVTILARIYSCRDFMCSRLLWSISGYLEKNN